MIPLPIDAYVDAILDAVRRSRAAVVTAAPGAGKTTRLPPALAADGRVILLQPRRVAARAIASRIATERGWALGREVGWQIRFERRFSADTRLLVVTEGILTARLQSDPLLSEFDTVVVDEFHERSIHADVALALARQAWRARDDLRVVVMSATLDPAPVSAFLDGCPIVDVAGRTHPLDITYEPGRSVVESACDLLHRRTGDACSVLCFLPGAPEIQRVMRELQPRVPSDVEVVPLHGSLDVDAQSRALVPSSRPRVIVATNIAETSLTVPGVTAVVDTGLQKVARYDAERGVDSLETERVTLDSADQRAGRAGRIAAGVVRRLWDARDRLRPHREPEIHRIDLSSAVLDILAWGGDPRTFEWFERPRADALESAIALLQRLGLITHGTWGPPVRGRTHVPGTWGPPLGGPTGVRLKPDPTSLRLTHIGEQIRRIPLHPRLARMLVAAGGSRDMARACALLSERHFLPPRTATTASDLLSAIDRWDAMPPNVQRAADIINSTNQSEICNPAFARAIDSRATARRLNSEMRETGFRRALLSAYPDRVARRREPGSSNFVLASGSGAVLAQESGVRDAEFLIAHDVSRVSEVARIRIATAIEREWLTPTSTNVEHRFEADTGTVKARRVDRYDALVLAEHPVPVDPETGARLLADAWLARGPTGDDERLLRRLRFASRDVDVAALIRTAAHGARRLDEVTLARALPPNILRHLDRDAPEMLAVPSGRRVRLEYAEDGSLSASVKLQEVFGLADTPTIGPRRVAVALALLAPNGRPVQITRDLRSFWDRTYPVVRKELRGRYPKHPWPEDPWASAPSARPKPRHG